MEKSALFSLQIFFKKCKKTLDNTTQTWYYIYVPRGYGKEVEPMDKETKKALQELLKILSDCPELADRITITIKPNSKEQGTGQK